MAENLNVGGDGENGTINVASASGNRVVRLQGAHGRVGVGGNGKNGVLNLWTAANKNTIRLQAGKGRVGVGGNGKNGTLNVWTGDDKATVRLQGQHGRVGVGGNSKHGTLNVWDKDNNNTIRLQGQHGRVGVGGNGKHGTLNVWDKDNNVKISLNANTGDIVLANADCAEAFPLARGENGEIAVSPGMVMVISEDGGIAPCTNEYDTSVAGVVSGAGDYQPAIVLNGSLQVPNASVALIGTVTCKVTAEHEPIGVGDLLTTSDVSGHARRASDRDRSAGAILGKAMQPLADGRGEIAVLVGLQ